MHEPDAQNLNAFRSTSYYLEYAYERPEYIAAFYDVIS